jgi:hypothetical protein
LRSLSLAVVIARAGRGSCCARDKTPSKTGMPFGSVTS